jgi:hypothetical protein
VSEQEARDFYAAASKGVQYWDVVRIRGTVKGHKKPYSRVSGPPADIPLRGSAAEYVVGRS